MVRYAMAGDTLGELSRNWWVLVVRGAAAVLFGLVALIWPGFTTVALAIVFGAFALVDGVSLAFAAYRASSGTRTPLVIQSVLGIVLGLAALIWPAVAVVALIFLIGAWAIVTGVAEIVTAVRLRARITSEWLLIFAGALSVIFGLLLWLWPGLSAVAVIVVIGIYAIVFGVSMVVAGFRLKGATGASADSEGPGASTEAAASDTGETTATRGGDLLDDSTEEEGGRDVNAFDEGYAGGYSAGYRGDPRSEGGATDSGLTEDEAAARRSGRHRAPKEPPEGTDTP
ncbi:HdeD family acid-resistance protein [Nocardiopsis sp. MG754419]|uniref:HdeD family acid-resistance protein n=1 Tax=Nocardiopsis sp. MG754419 TaxID=2259865 RepID=UPI001BAA16A1|nr:HdeD family acid-resistance protein [Nocardiopsis sp. MG754419]MBR8744344.1 HdeD family acid-resistance protein [Nocardiopsis sp. MG754419]